MSLEPQLLQALVPTGVEGVRLEDGVELVVGAPVEGDRGPRPQDALVSPEELRRREGPEEGGQTVDVAALVERLAHALHLERKGMMIRRGWEGMGGEKVFWGRRGGEIWKSKGLNEGSIDMNK